jgi:hypothetical protein
MTNLNPTEDIVFKLTVKKLDELDISQRQGRREASGSGSVAGPDQRLG